MTETAVSITGATGLATSPALLLVGHGSRSTAGVEEYWRFQGMLAEAAAPVAVAGGFIELAEPDLDTALDGLVDAGAAEVVAVPLVLLGAGHLKNDGPAALARARTRHPGRGFAYARDLGIHPAVLDVARDRIRHALGEVDPTDAAVVLVGRGSSDPDANGDLCKVARLLQETGAAAMVEPAFVSLAEPGVAAALERCRRLGAHHVAVVPYFLFTGILVDRIGEQALAWAADQPAVTVRVGQHLGCDPRIVALALDRYREAVDGDVRMNCDCCVYRTGLPGHEHRVGTPIRGHHDPHHQHDHHHEDEGR